MPTIPTRHRIIVTLEILDRDTLQSSTKMYQTSKRSLQRFNFLMEHRGRGRLCLHVRKDVDLLTAGNHNWFSNCAILTALLIQGQRLKAFGKNGTDDNSNVNKI
jgi:hypothetical protein